jgi:prenylcysteine alpha-carboxyl methylesterase
LYLPPETNKPKPVVIFVTGGAWVIGYKAWGSLLAQGLLECDIIVACLDYRNFPQGCISDMISDISTGIGYVMQNLESYGGDPNMVYLAGQSAGAHLASCALLLQAEKELTQDPAKLTWRSSQFNACMLISGGYNMAKLVDHFHKRGLYRSIFVRMMEGENSFPIYSPEYMVMTPTFSKAIRLLPPITLYHGTGDYSIPYEASAAFAVALRMVGARVNTVFYSYKTHTDLILQDPMRGGKDYLLADFLSIVHANDEAAKAEDLKKASSRPRLVPEYLLQLARLVSPF